MSAADPLKGYKGRARARLEGFSVRVWSDVRATNDAGSLFEGVILPRSETLDDEHVVIKLKTGYNVGVHVDRVRAIEELGYREAVYKIPEKEFPRRPNLPSVTLLGTGGTIASRLDYRTGAVIPAFTPGELYGAVPELADICNLTTKKLFGVFSENMAMEQYIALATAIGEEVEKMIADGKPPKMQSFRGKVSDAEIKALASGNPIQAIAGFESAIHMYLPFHPLVEVSARRIWSIGVELERRGETEKALVAYRALRSAFYSTHAIFKPGTDWIARCDARIAVLAKPAPPLK